MSGRMVCLALVVVAGGQSPLAAQVTPPSDVRQGFWFGGGLGAGSGGLHCTICTGDQEGGTAAHLRAGTTINRRLLLGVEATGWRKGVEDGSRRVVALTANGYWYPNRRHGYFLKGGVGLSRYTSRVDQEYLTAKALALHAGVGYEVRLNPALSIAPFLSVLGSSRGDLWLEQRAPGSVDRNRLSVSANTVLIHLGIGLTRH